MDLDNTPLIPKGRCPVALETTPNHIDKLETLGVIRFVTAPTGRKYATSRSLKEAAEWLHNEKKAV